MSLEETLGAGATEAFDKAVTFADDKPSIIYGDWEFVPQVWPESDKEQTPWPGPGTWRTATVIWKNSVIQKAYFQNKVFFWGNGLCEAGPDELDRMGNADMWQFFNSYIEEMFIDLPSLPQFIDPFLKIGFEVFEEKGNVTRVRSNISEDCRMKEWIEWRENGELPEEEPEWRV